MVQLTEEVIQAWEDRDGPAVFTTVDASGVPNTIYVGCMAKDDTGLVMVADNYFDKTRTNCKAGCSGSFLFLTGEGKAYQLKGTVEYLTEGELFVQMKTWNPEKHPGHAVAVLRVSEIYSGSQKLA